MIEQRTAEWFAERAGKFTGSRFADLMARTKSGPSASRQNLITTLAVERITGKCIETYTNAAMQRGQDLEADAIAAYEKVVGVLVEPVGFVRHKFLMYVGVSPDGRVGRNGLIEVKCPASINKHAEAKIYGAHAKEYQWQIQGQLWVEDRDWCDAVSYDPRFPEGLQIAITRVYRNESLIDELERECIKAELEVQEMHERLRNLKEAA